MGQGSKMASIDPLLYADEKYQTDGGGNAQQPEGGVPAGLTGFDGGNGRSRPEPGGRHCNKYQTTAKLPFGEKKGLKISILFCQNQADDCQDGKVYNQDYYKHLSPAPAAKDLIVICLLSILYLSTD